MNVCKAFDMDDENERYDHLRRTMMLEDFGDRCSGHFLHTWDDGHRYLCRCPECDALILVQVSELHSRDDTYYKDFFAVSSRDEAIGLNERYDGWQIEREYTGKKIYLTF